MLNVNELRAKHDALVIEAANMIAEFNPAHAKVFAEESFRRIGIFDSKADVCIKFFIKSFSQMA